MGLRLGLGLGPGLLLSANEACCRRERERVRDTRPSRPPSLAPHPSSPASRGLLSGVLEALAPGPGAWPRLAGAGRRALPCPSLSPSDSTPPMLLLAPGLLLSLRALACPPKWLRRRLGLYLAPWFTDTKDLERRGVVWPCRRSAWGLGLPAYARAHARGVWLHHPHACSTLAAHVCRCAVQHARSLTTRNNHGCTAISLSGPLGRAAACARRCCVLGKALKRWVGVQQRKRRAGLGCGRERGWGQRACL